MPRTTRVVVGLGVAALAFSLAACSSSGGGSDKTTAAGSSTPATSPAETTSSAPTDTGSATTTDYSTLLIAASDIPIPGFQMGTPETPPGGVGTTVAFTGDGGRTVGDTILVLPSADIAKTAATSSIAAAKTSVTGAEVSDAPIGDGGTAIRGTGGSGSQAVLIFTEGKAVVVLEFDSAASDPVPTDVIQQVATAQDGKIKSASLD